MVLVPLLAALGAIAGGFIQRWTSTDEQTTHLIEVMQAQLYDENPDLRNAALDQLTSLVDTKFLNKWQRQVVRVALVSYQEALDRQEPEGRRWWWSRKDDSSGDQA